MFYVVARINGIDRLGRHCRDVGDGTDDVGPHRGIYIEANLFPIGRVETLGGSVFVLRTAANVKELFHMGFCLKAQDALRKNPCCH